jgi:hypothetical protein
VVNNLKANLQDPHWISAALEPYSATPEELRAAFIAAEEHLAALQGTTDEVPQRLLGLVVTICISGATVRIEIRPEALLRNSPRLRGERGLCLTLEARLRRFASENKIVLPGRPRAGYIFYLAVAPKQLVGGVTEGIIPVRHVSIWGKRTHNGRSDAG